MDSADKIKKFKGAADRVGMARILDKIGYGAASSFECALDAHNRRQHPTIIDGFLSDAEHRAEIFLSAHSPADDVYLVLSNLR